MPRVNPKVSYRLWCLPNPQYVSVDFLGGSVVKNSLANAGDEGLILRSGRSPGVGSGNHSIILPGKFHGQRSLVGYSPWGRKESDKTEQLTLSLPSHYFKKCSKSVHGICKQFPSAEFSHTYLIWKQRTLLTIFFLKKLKKPRKSLSMFYIFYLVFSEMRWLYFSLTSLGIKNNVPLIERIRIFFPYSWPKCKAFYLSDSSSKS